MPIETGFINDTFPYIKTTKGSKLALIFPGSEDLLISDIKNARVYVSLYKKFFPKDYRLLIIGYHQELEDNHTPIDIADQFSSCINEINGSQPATTLMGISFGGLVAMAYAMKNVQNVESLILASSSHRISEEGLDLITRWMQYMEKNTPRKLFFDFCNLFKRKFYKYFLMGGITIAWPFLKKLMNAPYTLVNAYKGALSLMDIAGEFLPRIYSPTLVLGGTKDQIFCEVCYKETAELIPEAKLVLLDGETHTMLFEHQKACRKKIRGFLEEIF